MVLTLFVVLARAHMTLLVDNDRKEELSVAYVHAIAAHAGFAVDAVRKDRDSVDLKIVGHGLIDAQSTLCSPELNVQLKATARVSLPTEDFSFPVPTKNYNDLVRRALVPKILVVFLMPNDRQNWIECAPERLQLRHAAYWVSLLGQPESANVETKSVTVPLSQRLDTATLTTLMMKVSKEETL